MSFEVPKVANFVRDLALAFALALGMSLLALALVLVICDNLTRARRLRRVLLR